MRDPEIKGTRIAVIFSHETGIISANAKQANTKAPDIAPTKNFKIGYKILFSLSMEPQRTKLSGRTQNARATPLAMKIELGGPNFTPQFAPGPVHCSAGLGAIVTSNFHPLGNTRQPKYTFAPRPGATNSTAAGRPLKPLPTTFDNGEPMKMVNTQSTFEGALKNRALEL